MSWAKELISGLVSPITNLLGKRQERKQAVQTAQVKLQQVQAGNAANIQMNDQEWEAIMAAMTSQSWKDEYVTISVVSFLNLIIIGGVAQAFGYPQILGGVAIAIGALVNAGVNIGFLLEAVILSAVGLSIWRRVV